MKRIIISFDGTCNEPEDADRDRGFFGFGALEDDGITNVLKLHLMLGGDLRGSSAFDDQLCFYYKGVGTYGGAFQRAFNASLALQRMDSDHIILAATRDLRAVYDHGDELFVFGFSRVVAIARQLPRCCRRTFSATRPGSGFSVSTTPLSPSACRTWMTATSRSRTSCSRTTLSPRPSTRRFTW